METNAEARKAARVQQLLQAHYGEPALKAQVDPLSELVQTILSQNTNDTNSGRAFAALRRAFPTWEAVAQAPVEELAESIRVGGLANVKAPRIQSILQRLDQERGALDLGFLAELPVSQASAYLTALPGVGPKTAACVLLFSLHMPALPVDTHVHRIALRLELVPAKTSAEKAHALLEALVSPDQYYPFHLLFIQHGRTLCHAARPLCDQCPLTGECGYYADS